MVKRTNRGTGWQSIRQSNEASPSPVLDSHSAECSTGRGLRRQVNICTVPFRSVWAMGELNHRAHGHARTKGTGKNSRVWIYMYNNALGIQPHQPYEILPARTKIISDITFSSRTYIQPNFIQFSS